MLILRFNEKYRLTVQTTKWWGGSKVYRVERWRSFWRFHWWSYVEEFYSEYGDEPAKRRAIEFYNKLCRKDGLACGDELQS